MRPQNVPQLAALALLVAQGAMAEVRVVADGSSRPVLLVQAIGDQVWRPLGHVDAGIINPLGDVTADGHPASATSDGSKILVAWHHRIGHLVLDETGVREEAEFERGPSGSCTAILVAATRD